MIYIKIGGIIFYIIVVLLIIYFDRENKKYREAVKKEYKINKELFNKCVDLILLGDIEKAKKIYNLIPQETGLRNILNGVLIGIDIEKNKERLLECKFK